MERCFITWVNNIWFLLVSTPVITRGKLKPFFVKQWIMSSCRKLCYDSWFDIYIICCFNLKILSWLNMTRQVDLTKQINFSSHIKKILIQLCFNRAVQFTYNSLVKSTQSFTSFQLEIWSWNQQFSRPKISSSLNSVTRAALFQHWSRNETTPSKSDKSARR